ncbi:MAG TPA: hypothetical protein VFJ18_00985 [Pararhizobium sp.]|nr:hypothetical protein [Pararhizobium sp.]
MACVLGLAMAGCSDASGEAPPDASSAVFDAELEKTPCEIMPKKLVAKTFGIPADEIDETSVLSSKCVYEWEGNEKLLEVSLKVNVLENRDRAADRFHSVTRGLSAEELSDAMARIAGKAEETGKLDTEAKKGAAKKMTGALASGGLHFQEVEGVGDEARFGARFGTLYVLRGNLKLDLTAYHGPRMPVPETLSGGSIMKAAKAWQKETMPVRKQQSVELAKAIVEAL